MKARFTTLDIVATVAEIAQSCIGLRVSNVYDINNKTYLIRLSKPDHKVTLLFESGIRLHLTDFDWPKNITPSGFSMKLRKHIKNKRLEQIDLVGIDRIVRLQFGTGEWTFHLIVELYDKGNALLTDHQFTIVHLLRPRTDATDQTKIVTSETYQLDKAKQSCHWNLDAIRPVCQAALGQKGQLAKSLISLFPYGSPLLDHCLRKTVGQSLKSLEALAGAADAADDSIAESVLSAFLLGESVIASLKDRPGEMVKACVTTKPKELSAAAAPPTTSTTTAATATAAAAASASVDPYSGLDFLEFHPIELAQIEGKDRIQFNSFNKAVDEFFLKMESQRLDQKALQQEKAALKKLENIKQDHEKRLAELAEAQITDREKGELLQMNLGAVEKALLVINSALANQLDWEAVAELVAGARAQGDPVASMIQELRLDRNAIVLRLSNPFDSEHRVHCIEIDLATSAYGNVKRLFDQKKQFAAKEEKTKQASEKALKAADRKTHEMLKEAQKVSSIAKVRKPMWFEKFYWFVSSENYLVIGGRDQQQNELIVKRHLKAGDVYVHADLHGASSVVIKNPGADPVPPKTLHEAGQMAVVYSSAWSAKIVSNAWWVHHHQVSKVAPTGEYLTTGSFMIRGKKNYLPSVQLTFGFGFLFRIDEESVPTHRGERAVAPYSTATGGGVGEEFNNGSADDSAAANPALPALPEVLEFGGDADDAADEQQAGDSLEIRYEYSADGRFEVARQVSNAMSNASSSVVGGGEILADADSLRRRVDSVASSVGSGGGGIRRKMPAHERRAARKLQQGRVGGSKSQSLSIADSEFGDDEVKNVDSDGEDDEAAKLEPLDLEEVDAQPAAEVKLEPIEASVSPVLETDLARGKKKQKKQPPHQQQQQQQQQQQVKRGQRAKLKKMQAKYKDQDDEDRRLAMSLLQSDGNKLKQQEQQQQQQKQSQKSAQQSKSKPERQPQPAAAAAAAEDLFDEDEDDEEQRGAAGAAGGAGAQDRELLDSLTGQPQPDDILLFAIPVCAPISTLSAYKYKAKLTPGTAKRGKAVKTALAVFSADKACSRVERDLMRAVKDNDLCCNLPGKVKLSLAGAVKQKK